MKGATEYCEMFKETQQIGKLYFVVGSHARGTTFKIYILPEGEKAVPNGSMNPPINKDKIEVYGVICGNPGWTEEYGWLHGGKWQEDFYAIVEEKKSELLKEGKKMKKERLKEEDEEKSRIDTLLSSY